MRRRMPVVRCENDVESPAFPAVEVDSIVERACSFPAQAIVITGGEPSLYPLDYLTEQLAARGLKIFLETSGAHPLSGPVRLDLPVAQETATSGRQRIRLRQRTENHHRNARRFPVGRTERRESNAGVYALPATRMEPLRPDDRRDRRIRQSASALEHLRADPQIHADTLTRLRMGKQAKGLQNSDLAAPLSAYCFRPMRPEPKNHRTR